MPGGSESTRGPGAELIRRARAGEGDAVADLIRASWDAVFRAAYAITGDRGGAEDVAQETMLAAVRSLGEFDDARPFGPWVSRIAANKAHDWLRRRRRRPEVIVSSDDQLLDPAEVDGLDLDAYVPGEILMDSLMALPAEFREAVVLRHLLDFSPPEIAEITGVPAATARSRIHRGLTQLKRALDSREEAAE